MLNDYSKVPSPMPIGFGLLVKRSMCIGFSLFISIFIAAIMTDTQFESEYVPFVAIPTGLFLYFFTWKIYKYRLGKTFVVGANILFCLLTIYFVISE